MTLKQIFIKRFNLIAVIFVILFTAALFKVILFPVYKADALIMVDIKKGPTTAEIDRMDANQMLSLVRVHISLLQSDPVLKKVVEDLKLYDELLDKKGQSRQISEEEKEKAARQFIGLLRKKYLTISSAPFTNLIEIKGKYKKQQLVAEVVNAIVKNYLNWNLNFQHSQADKLIDYLGEEVRASKELLHVSEDALRSFREENKIISLPDEVKAYFQILPEEFKSHYMVLQALEIKLFELEVELSRLRELYAEESPQIIYLKKTIEEAKGEIDRYSRQSSFSEEHLSTLRDVPKEEMMLARLVRDVKVNESLYTFLVDELERAKLLKAKQTVEDIKVVHFAETPLEPSERLKGIVIGSIISFILALLLAVVLETKSQYLGK